MTADQRRNRSAATRDRLLETAAERFAVRGYDGTTLDDLARRAGVNKAMVRYHFGGKQGLYSEVLRAAIRIGRDEMEPILDSRGSPEERLAAYVDALMRFLERAPHFPFMILREEMSGGHRMEKDIIAEFLRFFAIDRDIIEQGKREGRFRDVDPHETHLSLVGSIVFFLVSQPWRDRTGGRAGFPGHNPALGEYAEHVKTLFLSGLKSDRPNSKRKPGGA